MMEANIMRVGEHVAFLACEGAKIVGLTQRALEARGQ